MRLNKTRIILIIMIVSTILLGGVAVFIGWKLQQNQVSAPTKASSCSCPSGYQGPDKDNKCWSETQTGATIPASCTGDVGNPTKTDSPVYEKDGSPIECVDYCCTPSGGQVGCVRAKFHTKNADGTAGPDTEFNVNGGAAYCNNGNHVDPGSCQAAATTPSKCGNVAPCASGQVCVSAACKDISTNEGACKAVGGCWNTDTGGSGGCTAPNDIWCGPGNCVAGRTDLCQYKCVGGTAGIPGTLGSAVNQNVACVAGSCQTGYCLNKTPGANFGQCILDRGTNKDLCAGSGNALGSCKLCDCSADNQCDYNGGQECRKNCRAVDCNVTIPNCAQLDFGCLGSNCGGNNINKCANCPIKPTTSTTKSSTGSSSPIIPTSLKAMIGGRVYCQDTGGQPIPISNAVVAINVGSTVVNATTNSDGYYTSSEFTFPVAGVAISADVSSLPTTFNNGLPTSQLQSKTAEHCTDTTNGNLQGCTGGTSPNYYCDSSTSKSSYANCTIKSASAPTYTSGFRGFRFVYKNCAAQEVKCGDGTVDIGEACDPVGSVGQCANGGKCLNGCTCSTCGSTCTTNDQCPNGYACSNGLCRNPACPNANECSCGTTSVPSTALFDDNKLGLVFGFMLILLGVVLLRSKMVIGLVTPALVGVFGTSILKYIDPDLAKREYEKNVIDSDQDNN